TSDRNGSDSRAFPNPCSPRSSRQFAGTRIPKTAESTNLITDTEGHYHDYQIASPIDQLGEAQLLVVQLRGDARVYQARWRRDPDISLNQIPLGLVKRAGAVERAS